MAKTSGLKTEILVTLTLLLGAALLFAGLVMLRFTETSLLEERLAQLDILTRVLSLSGELKQSPDQAVQFLNQFSENSDCQGWWLYDSTLTLVGSVQQNVGSLEPFRSALLHQVKQSGSIQRFIEFPYILNFFSQHDSRARFIVPLVNQEKKVGVLELSYSLEDIKNKLSQSFVLLLVYIFLYGIVLISAGFFLLQRNIIKPARVLLDVTGAVEKGDLDKRLPIAGPTEIRQLASAYNNMAIALKKSRAETTAQIKNLEETNLTLQQARNELIHREKMASVGHLAAGLAHELGNPLAALIGYLELLKSKIHNHSELDLVERSLVETNRIDFLVRELLNFSRPDNLDDVEEIFPVSVLRDTISLLVNQGTIKDIEIQDDLHDIPSGKVRINEHKLRQVFINLLLNAAQACDQNGKIVLTAEKSEQNIRVTIQDNGRGIAKTDLERIFEPFYTTKEPGQGTGLGLAVCRRIVDEAGGRIEVESISEEGSRFTIFLKSEV